MEATQMCLNIEKKKKNEGERHERKVNQKDRTKTNNHVHTSSLCLFLLVRGLHDRGKKVKAGVVTRKDETWPYRKVPGLFELGKPEERAAIQLSGGEKEALL